MNYALLISWIVFVRAKQVSLSDVVYMYIVGLHVYFVDVYMCTSYERWSIQRAQNTTY